MGFVRITAISLIVLGIGPWAPLAFAEAQDVAKAEPSAENQSTPKPNSVFVPMRAGNDQAFLDGLYDDLAAAGDEDAAEQITNNILKVWSRSGSDTVDLLALRARKASELEEDEITEKLLSAIVDIAPNFAEGWNRRATYYFKKSDFARAVADVQRVLALDPRHFGALSGLGAILEETGQSASALEVYRKALEVHPFLPGPAKSVEKLEIEVEGREI